MATIYGNKASSYWQTYVDYVAWEDDFNFYITATIGVYWCKAHVHDASSDRPVYLTCNGQTHSFTPNWSHEYKAGKNAVIGSASWQIPKTTENQSIVLTGYNGRAGGSAASVGFTVGKRVYYISFDANGGEGAVGTQTKRHDEPMTLTELCPTKPSYDFVGWNTAADGSGTTFEAGGQLPADLNQDTTLYAVWHVSYAPPRIEDLRAYRVSNVASGRNPAVKPDGERGYCDLVYIPSVDPDATTNYVKIQFGTATPINASSYSTLRFGYSESGHLPLTSSEVVTVSIKVTDYKGVEHTYEVSTFISSENYVFDAYKGTRNSEEYSSFAIGGIARDIDSSSRSKEGNFDVYMDMSLVLRDGVRIVDTGTTISVSKTGTAETADYKLAKAIADTFSYADAKEILEV